MIATSYSDEFISILQRCEVDLWHLRPANPASLGMVVPEEFVAAARHLGETLCAPHIDVMRAAFIIGMEAILGEANEAAKNRGPAHGG